MKKESTKTIGLEEFKELTQTTIYTDDDIAIFENIRPFSPKYGKEVKLKCLIICFCEKGETTFSINHRIYTLKKAHCAILPPGTIISGGSDAPHTIKTTAISQNFLEEIMCINKETLNVMHYLYNNPIHPTGRATSYKMYLYKELLMTLIKEQTHAYSKQTRRHHFAGMICEMFALISEKIPTKEKIETKKERTAGIVHDFIEAVSTDDGSHRSVSYYANKLCYSAKHLSYSVKQATGKTPLQIINAHAISQIKHKLKYSDTSMKCLADYFDFPSPSFFGKFVKAHTGVSPLQYRETQKDEE